jgi:F-type H+-transporting ATPase subunit b
MIRRTTLALHLTLIALMLGAAVTTAAAQEATESTAPSGEAAASGEAEGGHGHHEDPTKTFNFFHFNYWGKDRYGGPMKDGVEGPHNTPEEPMSAPFVLMLVNFGLVLLILAKYGAPAARKMAESRSDQIKHALDEATALRAKAAAKLAEYDARLSAADAEITKMVESMRADAEAEKQRIATAAAALATSLQKDADQRIAAEIERARFELRAEVTAAAMAVAEQLLTAKTTGADQSKLFEQFVGDMQRVVAHRASTTPIAKERS